MSKKIKITETQLMALMENNKKTVKEQYNGGDDADVMDDQDDFNSMKRSVSKYMNDNHKGFASADELVSSISERLANAIGMKEWSLVEEVFNDVRHFMSSKVSQEDQPTIGEPSCVESDDSDQYQERHMGISESVEKIKTQFKRFI